MENGDTIEYVNPEEGIAVERFSNIDWTGMSNLLLEMGDVRMFLHEVFPWFRQDLIAAGATQEELAAIGIVIDRMQKIFAPKEINFNSSTEEKVQELNGLVENIPNLPSVFGIQFRRLATKIALHQTLHISE